MVESELIVYGPKTYINLVADYIPPFRTYWLSSFINYLIKGNKYWYAWSLEIAYSITLIAKPTLALTMPKESFPKFNIWGTKILIFYGDITLTKLFKDFTAYILTSTYESFSKFAKVCIKLISVIYFPKFEAINGKFLDRQSLTLHDLSYAAWIIRGIIKALF